MLPVSVRREFRRRRLIGWPGKGCCSQRGRRDAVVRAVAGRGVDRAMALATGTGREFAWHSGGQVRRVSGHFGAGGDFVGSTGKGYGPGYVVGRTGNVAGRAFKDFNLFLAVPERAAVLFLVWQSLPAPPVQGRQRRQGGIDPAKVRVPPYLPDNETIRNDIADYYLAAQAFDRAAGEVLAALEKTGELDNTLIVMSGDNGWPFPRCKATCYDSGTHQPLAVRWGAGETGTRG